MKRLALTFDDGPHPQLTRRLLNIASTVNAKLTFFVLGKRIGKCDNVIQEALQHGHEVGNHGWSHRNFKNLNKHEIREELLRTDEAIRCCGGNPCLMRPPYGEISQEQRRFIECELHYKTVLWSVDSNDWRLRDARNIAEQICKFSADGAIVLLHDIHPASIDAVSLLIKERAMLQYELVTISQLAQRESHSL